MHAYVTTEAEILSSSRQTKATVPASRLDAASASQVQLGADEYLILKDLLKEKYQLDDEAVKSRLSLATGHKIAKWEYFPPRLGRISLGLYEHGKTQDHQKENNPLRQQLHLLRQRLPHKRHFRLALVNGFGSNLGDNLMGSTAFAQVARVLAAELGKFSVDVLLGWKVNPGCHDMLMRLPYVRNVYDSGLSLAEFGSYDAHFDTSHLLSQPMYNCMPTVDWYLWWMGLEPEDIPAADKRNHIHLPYSDWQAVASLLRSEAAEQRILFCHRASVPLRSIGLAQARGLARKLLATNQNIQLVVDFTLEFKHSRLLDLDGQIDSPSKFMALIAQVDGLFTIDSFSQHVADACATPTLLLANVLPPDLYPYYPHMSALLLPQARELPGWGRSKTDDLEEWDAMAAQYEQAWRKLKGEALWPLLQEQMHKRPELLAQAPAQLHIAPEQALRQRFCQVQPATLAASEHLHWHAEHPGPAWEKVTQRLLELGGSIVRHGSVVVHCSPGTGLAAQGLAERIYPRGVYHLWEPRRLYAQTQAAHFMLAGLDNLHLHQCLPSSSRGPVSLPDLDPYSESAPHQPGNACYETDVPTAALDSIKLPMCRLLIVQPPLVFHDVLSSGHELLATHKPWVLLGPLNQAQARQAGGILRKAGYALWAEEVQNANEKTDQNLLMVGVPPDQKADMRGFMKIEINEHEAK